MIVLGGGFMAAIEVVFDVAAHTMQAATDAAPNFFMVVPLQKAPFETPACLSSAMRVFPANGRNRQAIVFSFDILLIQTSFRP